MSGGTFLAGIVLALAVGAILGFLFHRGRRTTDPAITDSLDRMQEQIRDFEAQRQHMLGWPGASPYSASAAKPSRFRKPCALPIRAAAGAN